MKYKGKTIAGKEPMANWNVYVKTLYVKFEEQKYEENVIKQLKDLNSSCRVSGSFFVRFKVVQTKSSNHSENVLGDFKIRT
jgi:hypothetical protein